MPLVEGGHKILNKVREKVIVEIQHYTHRSKKKKNEKILSSVTTLTLTNVDRQYLLKM